MNASVDSMVEVKLRSAEDFLKIRETLTRIGVASRRDKVLFQSCHILHKQLFALDGKPTNFSDEDKARRNTIANLLAEWDLIDIVDDNRTKDPIAPLNQIKILAHKEKNDWKLEAKYNIGKKRSVD